MIPPISEQRVICHLIKDKIQTVQKLSFEQMYVFTSGLVTSLYKIHSTFGTYEERKNYFPYYF